MPNESQNWLWDWELLTSWLVSLLGTTGPKMNFNSPANGRDIVCYKYFSLAESISYQLWDCIIVTGRFIKIMYLLYFFMYMQDKQHIVKFECYFNEIWEKRLSNLHCLSQIWQEELRNHSNCLLISAWLPCGQCTDI